jgi:hypothetical protein
MIGTLPLWKNAVSVEPVIQHTCKEPLRRHSRHCSQTLTFQQVSPDDQQVRGNKLKCVFETPDAVCSQAAVDIAVSHTNCKTCDV